MVKRSLVTVQRMLTALHLGDSAQIACHLHADIVYDTDDERITGRDVVVAALSAPRYEQLEAQIVPGRVEQVGRHFIAHTITILRWRGSSEDVDVSHRRLAIYMRDDLIARIELLPTTSTTWARERRGDSRGPDAPAMG